MSQADLEATLGLSWTLHSVGTPESSGVNRLP